MKSIQLAAVTRRFGTFTAVDAFDLEVAPGEIVGLLGPNGAGKTTSVKMLMGMLRPTSGDLKVFGLDSFNDRVEVQSRVGYLPDDPTFQSHLRGIELLEFVSKVRGIAAATLQEFIDDVGAELGLTSDLGEFAANYSKGMKKKLAFMMALVHKPDVLIMDEPTNGLDPVATRTFLQIVRARAEAGSAILYSTHLLDQAEKLCDRCEIMHQGRNVASGTVAELKAQAGNVATLEDVFFHVTGDELDTPNPPTTESADA
ncbi:MAG: ABC-2 type transport system ATP-binding protein [Pseudoalteromonas tetraodonis]|jgi:ABC-2 type transport system ATP-binding protein